MVELMCDDVTMIPPNDEPVNGPDVQEFYREVSEGYTFDVEMTTIETIVSGDLAFHQYFYDLNLTPRTEGDPVPQKGYGINLLKRRDDKSWCLSRLIWNALPSPSDEN
jgi:ketosteroid isomerase-like protein